MLHFLCENKNIIFSKDPLQGRLNKNYLPKVNG